MSEVILHCWRVITSVCYQLRKHTVPMCQHATSYGMAMRNYSFVETVPTRQHTNVYFMRMINHSLGVNCADALMYIL